MIQLVSVSKSFATNELFGGINFKLNARNRVGLVGRNGSGKSTLFKIILGEVEPDNGEIFVPKNYKIGALKQHLEFTKNNIRDEVSLALSHDAKYDLYKVEKILFGLGFSKVDLDLNPLSFSGGYQIRINLAKLLVAEPNLLLLDEPTNYLDIVSLRWLETFLRSFDGEVLLITHNRDFMDKITTHTMGIIRKRLHLIAGDTHKFYEQLSANDELYAKEKISQDKKIKELENFIAKNKARASTASLAQSKAKQLQKIKKMDDLGDETNLRFDFNFKETPAKILLEVKDLSFGYDDLKVLFQDLSFVLKKDKCLGIIGKNGKGKSTLLNVLAKKLKQNSGEIKNHPSVSFAHFGQTNINHLNLNNTVFEEIYGSNTKLSTSQARGICGSMMFSGEQSDKKISLLSGGEKSRVMLGKTMASEVNLLFLDEPTNHLDMESIESLTQSIKNFKGSIVLVTHSEELLRSVANSLVIFSNKGAQYFDDGYDAFLEKIGWEDEEEQKKEKKPTKSNRYENKKRKASLLQKRNKLTNPLKKEIEKQENFIIKQEELLEQNQQELIKLSAKNESSKIIDLYKIIAQQETAIEETFEKLEVSQEKFEDITQKYEKELEKLGV
ncbi:MAG: ATP-binding cassette domain-containing protein [Epsilonproteobacteria bacterium]|nr:ATP-binding cassette domain-containing protein [Campylobacterota bacterium]